MKAMYVMNEKLNGIEITFEGKPSEAIRKMMKDEGYRWHRVKQLWYAKYTENREKAAKQVCEAVKGEKPEPKAEPKKKATKKAAPKKKVEVVNSAQKTETPKKAPTVLKTKKIRNVPRDVCVGESMIAYNYAFAWGHIIRDELEKCETEMQKGDLIAQWIDKMLKMWVRDYPKRQKDFNLDAIKVALNQGLRKYIDRPFIANDYAQVGNCFKMPYIG